MKTYSRRNHAKPESKEGRGLGGGNLDSLDKGPTLIRKSPQ
jgi:hypothetical protein